MKFIKKLGIVVLILTMSACSTPEKAVEKDKQNHQQTQDIAPEKQEDEDRTSEQKKDDVDTQTETPVEKNEQEPEVEKEVFDQDQFIINTFASYNYQVPDKSQWQVKEEGPNKVAVIIKENLNRKGKPDISKLVFLLNSDGEPEILHLMIKNQVMI